MLDDTKIMITFNKTEKIFIYFQRIIAFFCLFSSLFYWFRLIGLYPEESWRFDLMSLYWKIASVSLAVFFPFAAIGLWLCVSWGGVLWFLCLISEMIMYVFFVSIFGKTHFLFFFHLAFFCFYIFFMIKIKMN